MRFLLSIGLIVLIILTAAYVNSLDGGGHAKFRISCTNCHIAESLKERDDPSGMTFLKDVSLLCIDCHDMTKKASHPVGSVPSINIPQEFPLDWRGKTTCITCHAVHNGGYGRYFLRSEKSLKAFCIACHGKNFEDGIGMHKMTGSAHFGTRYTIADNGVVIDELSIQCLSCHDGQLGNNVPVNMVGKGIFEHPDSVGVSHPIGVDYIKAASASDNKLVKPSFLPKEIKLFGGKVGCGSCHNPYSDRHSQLVMANNRSALCFACHIK